MAPRLSTLRREGMALVALVALTAVGCNREQSGPPIPRRDRPEKVAAPAPAQGSVLVKVVLDGAVPKGARSSGPCALPPPTPGAQGELSGVAVWTDLAASAPRPGAGAVELGACALEPSLMVLPPGSAIAVTNPSTGEREVRLSLIGAAPDAPPFASRSLKAGAVAGLKAPAQGRADLSCTGEPCEGALVVAAIGGLTDRAGAATLRGVKPGSAVVHAWHPALGETEASVEVVAGAVAELTLHLKAASVAP